MVNKGLIGVVFFALLVAGCSASPPPPEEILRQLAADAAGKADTEVVPATPEDAAAIQRAAVEVDDHVRRQKQETSTASPVPKTDYEVSVTAPRSMAGTWRLVSPTMFTFRSGAKDEYANVHPFLCRVDQAGETLHGSCLPTRAEISGKIRDETVDLRWVSVVVSAKIAGQLVTPTDFAGNLSLGLLGVKLTGAGIPVYAVKIPSSTPAPPQIDTLAARLFADLGAVRERLYLGAVDAMQEKPQMMHIFDVELDQGWKLCGFTEDGGNLECR